MKKNKKLFLQEISLREIQGILRISFLIILLNSAPFLIKNVSAQDKGITLNLTGATVATVLEEIQSQSDFDFIYNNALIDVERVIDIKVRNKEILTVLKELFDNTDVKYVIQNKHIVLSNQMREEITRSAEGINVSGLVTDEQNQPIIGVTVAIKGTTRGTTTNINGEYSLDGVPENAILIFSFVGMKSQEKPANKTILNITLKEEAIGFDEVVVIGYGTMNKREISGSVANVSEKNFNKGVTRTAADLLQGKVAGLSITQAGGDVTSQQTIRLRGTSSLTGSSEPFVVIDGVPGLSLNAVAPQDIESISILKDASSAAIYGSRSASGVILITTKKGKKNQPSIQYNGYVANDFVSNKPDLLTATEWREFCTDNDLNTEGLDQGADTDWFNEILRVGKTQNHDLSFSGASDNSSYRASFNYQDREGIVKDNEMTKLNTRVTFNQKALEGRLNTTVTASFNQRDYTPANTENFILAYNMIPVYPVKNKDGTWFDSQDFDQGNPVRNIELNSYDKKSSLNYVNIKSNLEIFDNFFAGVSVMKERESNDYGKYNHSETQAGRDVNGYARRESSTADKKLLELTLKYNKEFGVSKLDFVGGYSYEENHYQSAGAQNEGFATDVTSYNNLAAGENLLAGDVWSHANMNKLISFFARANYVLKERYILTATLRRDGSSKFGDNHKWGTFPSLSAAWRIIDNPTGKIDELKLRAGYGIAGNQAGISPYQSLNLYASSGQYYDDGAWYTAYKISQNANPDLKWEETSMLNIGLDYSFFNYRLSGSLELYDKKTTDLLYTYEVPIPPYLYHSMLANVGDMSNKGIELFINGDIIRKGDFRWTVSANIAHNKNKLTKLSNDYFFTESVKTGSAWIRGGSDNTTHIIEEGQEVGTFYGWKCLGIDEDGNYIMDETIDGEEGLSEEDKTYIGSAQPNMTYGISNSLSYKDFELSFFLRGVHGNDVLNYSKLSYAATQWLPGANVLRDALTNGLNATPIYSSYYIEDGSFLRMDNATFAYNINVENVRGISAVKVYFSAQNLFTITNYSGLDPEVDMSGLDPGVEGRHYYPKSRTFSMGINVNF